MYGRTLDTSPMYEFLQYNSYRGNGNALCCVV